MLTKQFALAVALFAASNGNAFADQTVTTSPQAAPVVGASASLIQSADWQLLMEQRYAIPYGYGYSPIYDFGQRPLDVESLLTQMFVPQGGFCGASLYSLDYTTSPAQTVLSRAFPDATGVVRFPNAKIYKLSWVFYQSYLRGGNCIVRLSGKSRDGGTDNPSGDFELAGVLRYNGGFQNDLTMATDASDKVKRLWFRVPAFCGEVELLAAGTITEGHYEAARLIDAEKHIYEINGGAGSRFAEVKLSMNGPRQASCDIPVYFLKVME